MDRLTFASSASIEGNTLSGVAHVFGQRAKVGNRYIEFARGAFDQALQDSDVRAFYNHNHDMLLGRQSAGTLQLSAEGDGLHYAIDLPDTSYVADMKVLVDRKDLTEMSFGIMPGKFTFSKASDGKQIQTHLEVASLFDISPVALPAFGGTTVQLHSLNPSEVDARTQLIKARQRALTKESHD
jgi:HK97 family phage prohead protease